MKYILITALKEIRWQKWNRIQRQLWSLSFVASVRSLIICIKIIYSMQFKVLNKFMYWFTS